MSGSLLTIGTSLEPRSNLAFVGIEASSHLADPQVLGAVEYPNGPADGQPDAVAESVPPLAVVQVSVTRCDERASGTGVVVANNTVVTAAHIVGDAGIVRIDYGPITVSGVVVGVLGDGRDLAVVEIDAPLPQFFPATTAELGEDIRIMGFPEGGPLTTISGAAVEVEESVAGAVAGPVLGVQANTGPGFSGGPAVNAKGQLVGIAVAVELRSQTALISPIDDVGELLAAPLVGGTCPQGA